MYTVEIIDSLERFDDLKQDWERLFGFREHSIFFSFYLWLVIGSMEKTSP